MKKLFQVLAIAVFAATLSVPAVADTPQAPATQKGKKKTAPKKKERTPVFLVEFPGKLVWEVNYPRFLFPPEEQRKATRIKGKANIIEEQGGYYVEKKEAKNGTDVMLSHPLSQVQRIKWPDNDPRLSEAQAELVRGNPSSALEIAERFLMFFKPIKTVEGSPWIRAAVIKLDALDQQANDAILDMFIGEIESTPGYQAIEELPQKIELARLNQLIRRGENANVLAKTDEMIAKQTKTEMLARLHIIKGNALYNLSRYEDALNTYLRIPVFYGNEATFMPPAKLAIARCLRRMDRPELKAMNLAKYAEEYLVEIISDYPMSLEAKTALDELPKHKRDAIIQAAGSLAEQAARRADVTSQIEIEQSEDTADSDEDSYTDDSTSVDDSDNE